MIIVNGFAVGRYVDLFLSGFETHINPNNGAVAEWHEGDELQPHTHWFDPSPRLNVETTRMMCKFIN